MYFEVALRMTAYRTNLRCLRSYHDVTAVSALPDFYFALSKNFCCFYILKKCAISFLVMFFDFAYETEFRREFREAFRFCGFCKIFIHISPFIIFTFCRCQEVLRSISDAVQFLKLHLRVFFFVVSWCQE